MRRKKIILEDSDDSDPGNEFEQRTRKAMTNATRNNTLVSTTN
eukprot:CAMPEP_0205814042 /NCGR_PEP_ID=MMETSP0205-20121125/18953_1 /ASSEMBLY_ACC=CAM_ASM_000278 /TAXON_ID=36767 /ORGANISM="Euplotes focardii, Strain TN1" /LENGTH=42 /DNA_ID= /DNA_START= /DNA_END= /DNA_ORIENTATION=